MVGKHVRADDSTARGSGHQSARLQLGDVGGQRSARSRQKSADADVGRRLVQRRRRVEGRVRRAAGDGVQLAWPREQKGQHNSGGGMKLQIRWAEKLRGNAKKSEEKKGGWEEIAGISRGPATVGERSLFLPFLRAAARQLLTDRRHTA